MVLETLNTCANSLNKYPDVEFVQATLAQLPLGLAEYRLTEALPDQIKTNLPTIEQIH